MDIMLKWIAYVILSAAETWIGYRLFNTYLTRNSVRQRYYWLGVIFYFTFQMFSYVNAVSYTHLDVYKRQVKQQTEGNFPSVCLRNLCRRMIMLPK